MTALESHNQAMEALDEADRHRLLGNLHLARAALERALEHAVRAADLAWEAASPVDRAVLHRSAASVATELGHHLVAERLVARALSVEGPTELANELRDLLETIHFQRHLELRGWELHPGEIQMSISGPAVGFGMASLEHFVGRIQDFERLIVRTAERRLGRPYREAGRPRGSVQDSFHLFLSPPRAASFAVTARLGRPSHQLQLLEVTDQVGVINELIDLLELAQNNQADELAARLPELPYRRNFFALARRLAPDGEEITQVGFTAVAESDIKGVGLTRPAEQMLSHIDVSGDQEVGGQHVVVSGRLLYADETTERHTIKLREGLTTHHIRVPEGMMADIVKPLWESDVTVRGVKKGRYIELIDIGPASL